MNTILTAEYISELKDRARDTGVLAIEAEETYKRMAKSFWEKRLADLFNGFLMAYLKEGGYDCIAEWGEGTEEIRIEGLSFDYFTSEPKLKIRCKTTRGKWRKTCDWYPCEYIFPVLRER